MAQAKPMRCPKCRRVFTKPQKFGANSIGCGKTCPHCGHWIEIQNLAREHAAYLAELAASSQTPEGERP